MIRSVAAVLACASLAAPARGAAIQLPRDPVPPALASCGSLDGAEGVAVSADRRAAVVAAPSTDDARRSVLCVGRADSAPASLELPGHAFAVAISPEGDRAFVALRERGRKADVRAARLLSIRLDDLKIAASTPLPRAAGGIALRDGDDALLVASTDEVRTFLLPELTSGPLYRVLGDNLAVAPVAGEPELLVAQGNRVVLVDLTAPQGRNGLPVVDSVALPDRPAAIVSSPDEPEALVLGEDGGLVRLQLDPLRAVPDGRAQLLLWPGTRHPPSASVVAVAPEPVPTPEPTPVPPPPPAPTPTPVPTAPPAPPPPEPPAPLPSTGPTAAGTIAGTTTGTARAEVATVVAFGPDNILHEAGRGRPDASGRWSIAGLAPGTYRIVAVGDGGRVLICDPPFATVKVDPGAAAEAPALNVVGTAR